MHYLGYTEHQISLYGSVQSQQSLFITYWLYIRVYKGKLLTIWRQENVEQRFSSLAQQNLKVGGSNPLLCNIFTMNDFSLHPAVAWYFARLFITKRWLAFIRQTLHIQNAKFFTFWHFPPNAQNSWREPWIPIQLLWVARLDADIWTAKPYVFEPHWLNSIIHVAHFHFWQFGTLVSRISQLHSMFSLFHKFIQQSSSFGCSFFISWRNYFKGRHPKYKFMRSNCFR